MYKIHGTSCVEIISQYVAGYTRYDGKENWSKGKGKCSPYTGYYGPKGG